MSRTRPAVLLVAALLLVGASAQGAVHRVFPGESIQAAIDAASEGDTILVSPGTYQEVGNAEYGLRISTNNLRLIGKPRTGDGEAGKVRVLHTGTQETGIYAAPAGCEYRDGSCPETLQNFYNPGFNALGIEHGLLKIPRHD